MQIKFFYSDVERITGVQRLRLHHWMKEGFLIPSGPVAKGHGTKNVYTREDLYKIALLKKLIENGMHGWQAASFVKLSMTATRKAHQLLKAKGLPGLILCVGLRFVSGKMAEVEPWIDIPSEPRDTTNRDTGTEIRRLFNKLKYDQIIAINMEKLIDEVDSCI